LVQRGFAFDVCCCCFVGVTYVSLSPAKNAPAKSEISKAAYSLSSRQKSQESYRILNAKPSLKF
jgi:hypothetical protein